MSHRYFTLLHREDDGVWAIEFGDYSRAVVQDELEDFLDHDIRRKDLRIIQTQDDQASINVAVAALNS
jgi:hypothetical protein